LDGNRSTRIRGARPIFVQVNYIKWGVGTGRGMLSIGDAVTLERAKKKREIFPPGSDDVKGVMMSDWVVES